MRSNEPQPGIAMLALLVVLGGGLLVLLAAIGAPRDISQDGHRIDEALGYTTTLITFYFVVVVSVLAWCLTHFCERPGHKAWYTHGDEPKHLILTGLLALSVFVFVDLKLIRTSASDATDVFWKMPDAKDALKVEVRGQQFEWHLRYAGPDGKFNTADDVETNGDLHLPLGKPVLFQIRAKDVIHSFFLPNFRLKQDAIPGRTSRMWVQAKEAGTFELACAELCGLGHYRMRGIVTAEEPAKFDAWIAKQSKEAAEDYDAKDKEANWGWDWEDK